LGCLIVFIEELNQDIKTTGTDKHLQRQRRSLVHLPDKGGGLEPNLVRILPCSKFCNDGNATNKAQVFLQLNIVQDDL
jgi:hypothetical protein